MVMLEAGMGGSRTDIVLCIFPVRRDEAGLAANIQDLVTFCEQIREGSLKVKFESARPRHATGTGDGK